MFKDHEKQLEIAKEQNASSAGAATILEAQLKSLRALNAELRKVLQELADVTDALAETANLNFADKAIKQARAALAKAV